MAADTLASYGSLARFRDVRRLRAVGEHTILGASGELSDMHFMVDTLDDLLLEHEHGEQNDLFPSEIHSFISRVLYNRRSKGDPLWNQFVVGGFRDGKGFLGYADLQGTFYTDDTIATGFGDHIARPLLRNAYRPDLTRQEAKEILEMGLRVLFYRDARSLNRAQIADMNEKGVSISEPFEVSANWNIDSKP